jgi:hypothetical protein
VQVVKVDMERRQVDLGLVEILDRVRESEQNRGPRRSRIDQAPPKGGAGKGATAAARTSKKDTKSRKQRPGRKERATKKRRG